MNINIEETRNSLNYRRPEPTGAAPQSLDGFRMMRTIATSTTRPPVQRTLFSQPVSANRRPAQTGQLQTAVASIDTTMPAPQPTRLTSNQQTRRMTPAPHIPDSPILEGCSEEKPNVQFDMPVYIAPDRPKKLVKKARHVSVLKKTASLVGLGAILCGGILGYQGYENMQKAFQGSSTVAALSSESVAPSLLKGEGDGRVNVLLMGIGGENHDGGDLTDTMMLMSVDPVNKKADLLSIPRDLWVEMPVTYYGSHAKINAAYSSGKYQYLGKVDRGSKDKNAIEAGFVAVDKVVSEVLGVSIHYHALVDFKAFEKAVDTVNGVEMNIAESLVDQTMAWENGWNPVLVPAGNQTLDGKKALMYARSRYTSSDFARSERQRQLLVALKQKVISMGTLSNPTKLNSLMNTFGDNVYSDLSPTAATRLLQLMKDIPEQKIASLNIATPPNELVQTDQVGTASVVRPKLGFSRYSEIQTFVRQNLRDGYIVKENAQIAVVAPSLMEAEKEANKLREYGYIVVSVTAGKTLPNQVSFVSLSKTKSAPYTTHYLNNRFDAVAINGLPEGTTVPPEAQFAILFP